MARENPHIVGQCLSASEPETLVADSFANFLGSRGEVLDRVDILPAKAVTAVGYVQGAVGVRADG
ncbi:MAG: hypothetical protein OXH09_17105 [Gammaproteobacteria bacterium]|nr:hypothetical protein [Gammaproteobacteria bacterium]